MARVKTTQAADPHELACGGVRLSGADAFATNTRLMLLTTPQLLLDPHLQDLGCLPSARAQGDTAVYSRQVDSGRAESPRLWRQHSVHETMTRTTRIVESGSVLFCCRSYPLVALSGEYPHRLAAKGSLRQFSLGKW